MSEAQEEKIREELILLLSRNVRNEGILNRLWKRYMKCISDTPHNRGISKSPTLLELKRRSVENSSLRRITE